MRDGFHEGSFAEVTFSLRAFRVVLYSTPYELTFRLHGLLIAVPVVLALFLFARGGKEGTVSYPYTAAAGLFTPNEQAFLRVLEQAAGEHRVFGRGAPS